MLKRISATINDQKKIAFPCPSGWSGDGFLFDAFSPRNKRPWLPQSANEWIDSASIAPELVTIAATVLVMAMPRLASNAKMIDFTEEFSCDMISILGECNKTNYNSIWFPLSKDKPIRLKKLTFAT